MPVVPIEVARLQAREHTRALTELADECVPVAGGVMGFSGEGSWTNQAAGWGLDGAVSEADVDRLVDFYISRGVEPQIELSPFADKSLVTQLGRRGFVIKHFENVMAREIDDEEDLRAGLSFGWPKQLEIVRVDPQDEAGQETFIDVSTSGWRKPEEPVPEVMSRVVRRMFSVPTFAAYVAHVDGAAAGGGSLRVTPEYCALQGTSVLPAFRRRGIQQALMIHRLEQARERGSTLALIESVPGIPTERNAERLGFQVAYTKVTLVQRSPV